MSTVSVALCTWNGERYLGEQLESILAQTRLPDEVVISDDGSMDATLSIADTFAASAPMPVTILRSEGRLGSTRNFERAMRHCIGDLIALSDQDDRWRPQRLALSVRALDDAPDAVFLFANGGLIDEGGRPLPGSLWERFHFLGEKKRRLQAGDYGILCRERFVTGATVMLRRSALSRALPIPPAWVHDAWLAIMLSFHGDLLMLDEPVIDYRVHSRQQVGAATSVWDQPATRDAAAHWARLHTEWLQADALQEHLTTSPPTRRAELRALYEERAAFLRMRDALPQSRLARTLPVLRYLSDYRKQAAGVPSLLKDWLLSRPAPLP